jgi:hypothetical protein
VRDVLATGLFAEPLQLALALAGIPKDLIREITAL